MKKIKIHYTISQAKCGIIKRVCVVGRSPAACGIKMLQMFPYHTFSFTETMREQVSDNFPSGIFNDDPVGGYLGVVVGGAALSDSGLQYQSHS